MDPIEILIIALLGGTVYLYLRGTAPTSPVSSQQSPTPQMSTTPLGPGAPVSSSGSTLSTAPSAAAAPLINPAQYCASSCKNAKFMAFLQQAISTRYLPANPIVGGAGTGSGGCPASSPTGQSAIAKFAGVGASLASVGVTAAAGIQATTEGVSIAATTAGAAIPFVGIGVAIVGLIATIFAHHAQAEKIQSNVLCENVPAANAALAAIDAALANGSMTPAQAKQAYAALGPQFNSAMRSDPSYKSGDALDGYNIAFSAVLAQRNLDLQG